MADFKIGTTAFPRDNIFSKCLSNDQVKIQLAGTISRPQMLVTIATKPFKMMVKHNASYVEHSFVIVEYKSLSFLILNSFNKPNAKLMKRFQNYYNN